MAIGFIKTVTGAGLAVPDEVSVVGYDGIEFADYCEPTLTTIRQPRRELGIAGARALLASLRDLPRAGVNPIVLRGELLVRDSTGSAAEESKAVVAR
jgi:LacI family transcriptional regulator, repressor for deo operon, udp, cdd, tsx, nupC, and nupG